MKNRIKLSFREIKADKVRVIDLSEEIRKSLPAHVFEANRYCPLCKGKGVFAGKICSCVTVEYPIEPEW